MNLPDEVIAKLHLGRDLAAELPAQEPMRSFVMVMPQAPDRRKHPELWTEGLYGLRVLRDPSSITGYEIRYVSHDKKYTDREWGMDYDLVLEDETTRIKRLFVPKEEDLAAALTTWITDYSSLREVNTFDSSLLTSPIDYYLDHEYADESEHLWRDN